MFDTNKVKGCLFGQAVGDALGLGSEFMTKADVLRFYPNGLTDYSQIIQDSHRRRWMRGAWTDDTDMMLCIANAIIETGKADIATVARNFKAWFNGVPMGIGRHTNNVLAIRDYEKNPLYTSELVWKISNGRAASNGGIMRTSVVGLLSKDVEISAENMCKLTHFDPRCVGSCVLVSHIIHSLVYENSAPSYSELVELAGRYDNSIIEYVKKANELDFEDVMLDDSNKGYTLVCLFVALWCYFHAQSFEEGLLKVVNAGGDADTNAAVACAILGAKYGFDSMPNKYINNLVNKDLLGDTVNLLISVLRE